MNSKVSPSTSHRAWIKTYCEWINDDLDQLSEGELKELRGELRLIQRRVQKTVADARERQGKPESQWLIR